MTYRCIFSYFLGAEKDNRISKIAIFSFMDLLEMMHIFMCKTFIIASRLNITRKHFENPNNSTDFFLNN